MKPLSIWVYYWNNKRKIFPVIGILILSVLGMMAPPAILNTVQQDVLRGFNFYEKYIVVFINEAESEGLTKSQLEDKLINLGSVEHIIETQVRTTQRYTLSGDIDTPVFFLKEKDYPTFFGHVGLKLNEGTMPEENSNEVVFTTQMAKNKQLFVGEVFGQAVDEYDTISGEFVLSGTVDTDSDSFGLGSYGFVNQKQSITTWYLVAPQDGKYQEILKDVERLKKEHPFLYFETEPSLRNRMDNGFKSLNLVFMLVSSIIVIVIAMSVALLKIIFFMQRANEFGLLTAIGYSKKFILKKTILEVFVIIIVGWVLGVFITWGLFAWLNATLYVPKAFIPLDLFQFDVLKYSLPIPLAVSIFSIATVFWQLSTLDPVSIIERRD
ncbi:hypothetical protein CO180_02750 [candidate division WWE3 bacterium CG_4_9_14_3_um_filter_41_6]|nr:MAG: hypothetical protein CO180_02750 [candidate division WWE3 bacterium CG_4_9_14_3_um_filter_41_6]